MRAIEAEINRRRGEADRRTDIPLTNFRGIEMRDFSGRDRPPRAHHRRVSVRRALSRPEAGPGRVPAARRRELDHLRQRAAAGLAEHLPADRHGREASRRRFVPDAAGSGGDRLRERGRGDLHLRESAVSGIANGRRTNRRQTCKQFFERHTRDWKSLDYVPAGL